MTGRLMVVCCTVLLCSLPAYPHHSIPAHYGEERITIEGVVTKFELINPHARILFNVTKENGEVEHWLAEGESHGVLARRGWTGDELTPGERVKITGRAARDSARKMMQWSYIIKEDGTQLGSDESPLNSFNELRRNKAQEREQEK